MASENAASAAVVTPDRPDQPRHGKRGAPQAFARKLAEILRDEAEAVISWNEAGSAFMVKDVERFSQDVLVKHYRHSKFSSFQRQLNLYQFRKIVKGPDAGGYQHPMFHRERPEDLCHVRRSVSGSGSGAKATARRNGAAAGAASKQAKGDGGSGSSGWTPPRAHKSGAAVRRVGKLRNKARGGNRNPSMMISQQQNQQQQQHSAHHLATPAADHHQAAVVAPTAATAAAGGAVFSLTTDVLSSDAGDRSPWTSGESSDSDVSISEASTERLPSKGAGKKAAAAAEGRCSPTAQQALLRRPRGRGDDSSGDEDGEQQEEEDSSSEEDGGGAGEASMGGRGRSRRALNSELREQQELQARRFSSCGGDGGEGVQQQAVRAAVGGGGQQRATAATANRKSPFHFFKKTFSFMERQSSGHSRDKNTSSADAGEAAAAAAAASAAAAAGAAAASERPMPLASSSSSSTPASSLGGGAGPVSPTPLMVDTSAAARAAAAGLGVVDDRGVRPPPVTVTGGVHRIPMDPSTAAGNKALTSSPLTPKSSMEAAALAAAASAAAVAAAAAMPPPPRREQREELGLVEQLTNMVEVFDICDLLRKVSNSNSSRLDKHGGIVKPGAPPQHLRNMSVDTDPGLPPQSPGGGGSRQGQSPTGLGSLASMELARDSGKDWDTLMAGSADVSDLGNTMVQSVAEFFSF